ncbi:MAG: molybdopterin oxidoreductase membrane subunit [Candidatus Tectimicrobiota bacterium]|nr:MAG: molybdopterin oxidoreductase membrane subunit [Candidatus Tectomicrobia bacterium]
MEPIVLWQTKWSHGPYVPMYLFFGGLTTGVFITAVLADLVGIGARRFRPLSRVGAYCAVLTLALAGFFLTVHLGKPERGLAFPVFFTNYNSWMTRGGWVVGAASPLVVLYAALWFFGARAWLRRLVGVIGIPFLILLAVYTGLLLSHAGFVPLWSKKFLPVIFLNSGLTTGLAAAGLVFLLAWPWLRRANDHRLADPYGTLFWVSLAVVAAILLELYELKNFMAHLQATDQRVPTGHYVAPKGGRLAYEYVTQGALAPWFWKGIIGLGLLVPLGLTVVEWVLRLVLRPWERAVAAVKFASILVGGAILRFVIVWGGNLKAPLDFPPSKWPIPPLAGG